MSHFSSHSASYLPISSPNVTDKRNNEVRKAFEKMLLCIPGISIVTASLILNFGRFKTAQEISTWYCSYLIII